MTISDHSLSSSSWNRRGVRTVVEASRTFSTARSEGYSNDSTARGHSEGQGYWVSSTMKCSRNVMLFVQVASRSCCNKNIYLVFHPPVSNTVAPTVKTAVVPASKPTQYRPSRESNPLPTQHFFRPMALANECQVQGGSRFW